MRKRICLSVILCMLLVLLVGCDKKDQLTVYVAEEDALYVSAVVEYVRDNPNKDIDVVYFRTYEEMNEQLQDELADGKGPDVMLFNSLYSDIDPYKLAVSGSLQIIDEQRAGLSEEEYFGKMLDAGQVDGHQYYLPLSWNVLQTFSSEEQMAEYGCGEDLRAAFVTVAEAIEGKADYGLTSYQFFREDWMNFFMEMAGNKLFDVERGEVTEQKEEIKQTAEFVKLLSENYDMDVLMKYNNSGWVDALTYIPFKMENFSFINNVRFYETTISTMINSDMFFALFDRQDGEGITAQVIQYGAVNANTENSEAAWELLHYILNAPVSMDFARVYLENAFYAPVNMELYEGCIMEVKTKQCTNKNVKVGPLSDTYVQVLSEIPDKVQEAVIPNTAFGAVVQECMDPYLNGEESFDSCYDTLIQSVESYLSE